MSSIITKIITTVETDVTELFNAAEAEYEKLAPEVQSAIATASGILAIANKDVAAVPTDVWALIETKYPSATQESVTGFLIKIANTFNTANTIASSATFAEALTAVNSLLAPLEGNVWIIAIKAAVTIAVDFITPGTIIQKVEMVLEYVYQTFIKKPLPLNTAVVDEAVEVNPNDAETLQREALK